MSFVGSPCHWSGNGAQASWTARQLPLSDQQWSPAKERFYSQGTRKSWFSPNTTRRRILHASWHFRIRSALIQATVVICNLGSTCAGFSPDRSNEESYDFQFAKWMMKEKVSLRICVGSVLWQMVVIPVSTQQGIASIPPTAFFSSEHKHIAQTLVRFCFCKVI